MTDSAVGIAALTCQDEGVISTMLSPGVVVGRLAHPISSRVAVSATRTRGQGWTLDRATCATVTVGLYAMSQEALAGFRSSLGLSASIVPHRIASASPVSEPVWIQAMPPIIGTRFRMQLVEYLGRG